MSDITLAAIVVVSTLVGALSATLIIRARLISTIQHSLAHVPDHTADALAQFRPAGYAITERHYTLAAVHAWHCFAHHIIEQLDEPRLHAFFDEADAAIEHELSKP